MPPECWRRDRHLLPYCPAPAPAPDLRALVLALADHLADCAEVLARRAERREWAVTEHDYCPLG